MINNFLDGFSWINSTSTFTLIHIPQAYLIDIYLNWSLAPLEKDTQKPILKLFADIQTKSNRLLTVAPQYLPFNFHVNKKAPFQSSETRHQIEFQPIWSVQLEQTCGDRRQGSREPKDQHKQGQRIKSNPLANKEANKETTNNRSTKRTIQWHGGGNWNVQQREWGGGICKYLRWTSVDRRRWR